MKKWTAFLAIISLLLVGTFVIYKEAFARPYDCGMIEDWCEGLCLGDFAIIICEDNYSYIQCQWTCENISHCIWPCPWGCGGVEGICWL